MRTRTMLVAAVVGVVAGGTAAVGCHDLANDPVERRELCADGTLSCFHTASGGHDGGTGGGTADCSGDPSTKNVIDACGVFAQADAAGPTEDGTMTHPYKTLQKALDSAGGKRVYACASAPFAEAVSISVGVEVYGGFDCAKGWAWAPDKRSALDGPADKVALTVTVGATGAKVEGFAITGASPSDPKGGGSSVAVAVDDVAATLVGCDVKAGDAADGVDGQTPSGMPMKGADAPAMGAAGAPTDACVLPAGVSGGMPGTTMCDDGMTAGGNGGNGGVTGTNNGAGQTGANGSPMAATSGIGGVGESAMVCVDGTKGKSGDAGGAGPGGSAAGDKLSLSGIANSDVTDGNPGTKAQGGGGGGGAKSGVFCKVGAMTVDGPGASGGGGAAGGCGGKGGGGGKAGGSSIAIVSLGTKLTIGASVTLATGKGGNGGGGATGQNGGGPGVGAFGGAASPTPPSKAGCQGGSGGTGGAGGPGGGGRGGHAIGIAYAKTPASMPMVKTFTPGTPGNGGTAGTGAPMSSNGMNGAMGQCWNFAASAACK